MLNDDSLSYLNRSILIIVRYMLRKNINNIKQIDISEFLFRMVSIPIKYGG